MFGTLIAKSPLVIFPLIALACSFATFVAVLVRALLEPAGRHRAMAALPLDGEGGGRG